jgi:hypothetical protein
MDGNNLPRFTLFGGCFYEACFDDRSCLGLFGCGWFPIASERLLWWLWRWLLPFRWLVQAPVLQVVLLELRIQLKLQLLFEL